ncbi:MAG: hypothetical protein J2P13_11245 [Acidobacteria bacterium]|nr:hypothetical protein [Acidobacteriota bacterium]
MKTTLFSVMLVAGISAGCGNAGTPTLGQTKAPAADPPAASPPVTVSAPPRASAAHVILLVEENQSFSTVYHNRMPWLSALGDKYGVATNYYSDDPGSLLDYLWLSSGSSESKFGCTGNDCPLPVTDDNIFRELNQRGMSWNVYAESLPSAGFMGASAGLYVKRHDPAVWYSDVLNSPQQQQKVVPFTRFAVDLAANNLPDYAIIVPNLNNDAHNGTPEAADNWLKTNIGPLLESRYFQSGPQSVMFITFDNGDHDAQGQVLTAVVGQDVIPGVKVDTRFRHENTLRTIMELLGLTHFPGASATAAPMKEFFK